MERILHTRKTFIFTTVLGIILIAAYLYALFIPGIWYNGTFLYGSGGQFSGHDKYARYEISISSGEGETDIMFSLNGSKHLYKLCFDQNSSYVRIYKDGTSVFGGTYAAFGDFYILTDDNGNSVSSVAVNVGNSPPAEEELYPNYNMLYKLAVSDKYNTRGDPVIAIYLFIALILLVLDIAFPNLFYHLRYGLYTDGGEPSDFYLTCRQISRAGLVIIIFVCVILTFRVH